MEDLSALLQVLNGYVAELGQQRGRASVSLSFYILEEQGLRRVEAELPDHGSLGPLFHAFGLISWEELRAGAGIVVTSKSHDLCTVVFRG